MTGHKNKFAVIHGNDVFYYARPLPTALKRNREAVQIGMKRCKWKLCAIVRKFIYELI